MKNILLATTALVMTAGFASAEITFSGKAEVGSVQTAAGSTSGIANGANVDATIYTGYDLNITGSTTTDTGIGMSLTFDLGGGEFAGIADKDMDSQDMATDATASMGITVGGLSIEIENDGVDNLYDDGLDGHDIGVKGAAGDLTFGVTIETDDDASQAKQSYSLGYTMGDIGVSISGDDDDNSFAKVSYTMGDIVVYASVDNDVNTFGGSVTNGNVTLAASGKDNDDWDASVSYTAGLATFNVSNDESDAWEADLSYNLGGATAFVAADSNDTVIAGVNFSF